MTSKIKLTVLSFSLFYLHTNATVCVSVGSTLWQSSSTWNTNAVPSMGDTVVIKHTVSSFVLLSLNNIHATIDTGAMLCCRNNLDLNNHAYVMNYGTIKASQLFIHSYAHLENNGFFEVYGGIMSVYDYGSAHDDTGTGLIHFGSGACCISSFNYFDNSQGKFSYQIIQNTTVRFEVENISALSYKWYFTDGSENGTSVNHIFSTGGMQPVQLEERDSCSVDYYLDTIYIPEVVQIISPPVSVDVYYDNNSYQLVISIANPFYESNNVTCELYDLRGRKLQEAILSLNSENSFKTSLPISSLAPAAYVARCLYQEYGTTRAVKFIYEK